LAEADAGDAFSDKNQDKENIEYHSMINALDKQLKEVQKEMRRIEEENGIFNRTRDTWMGDQEEEKDD